MYYVCMRGNQKALDTLEEAYGKEEITSLLHQKNKEGITPLEMLEKDKDFSLFEEKIKGETGHENLGLFESKFSILVDRPSPATCDMDRNISAHKDYKSLKEVLVEDRASMRAYLARDLGKL